MAWGTGAWGVRGWGRSGSPLTPPAPKPKARSETIAELRRLWGRDLYYDGDLAVAPAGDWLVIDREKALRQSVIHRIVTAPGEWRTLPEYGVGARLFVKAKKTPAVLSELRARIRTQLLRDPRIADVLQVDIESIDSGLKLSVKIIPLAQAERAQPLVIGVEVS